MKKEYCNLSPVSCKKFSKVKSNGDGYICCNCGKRVSRWIGFIALLNGNAIIPSSTKGYLN